MIVLYLLCFVLSSSAYSPPDKLFINCGSNSNATYGSRTFVGDHSVSFTKQGSDTIDQSALTTPAIYQTVRIFRRPSTYNVKLDSVGFYFVRLHFGVESSRTDLLASRFDVSASGITLLKNFSLLNSDRNPQVEEFLLRIHSINFEISFTPEKHSIALVNAIEVFLAPEDFIIPSDENLRPLYRLNIGGKTLTPENDTLWRNWSIDDGFLYNPATATNVNPYSQNPLYVGSVTDFTAPNPVYQTAKFMNFTLQNNVPVLMNVTWSFKVKMNSLHFVRAHFCDILSHTIDPKFSFYLYGDKKKEITPSNDNRGLATPFYVDYKIVSDASGLLNVSICNKGENRGFLNGLEVMEILDELEGRTSQSKSHTKVSITVGLVACGLILIIAFLVFLKCKASKKTVVIEDSEWSLFPRSRGRSSDTRAIEVVNDPLRNFNLGLKISFSDILEATNDFDKKLLIGRGGFGNVYKGILRDGSRVAIKRAEQGSGQGLLEFQTEIQVLSRIKHRHLVSLVGYCEQNSEMILVYEFMEKGTLREHLYGSNLPSLTWKQRLEICIGAGRGLHYLHNGSGGAIIHRDVKSTNILLDENLVAKVADFGLSKYAEPHQIQQSFISSNVKGTFGYLDPEYFHSHRLTEKSDIFSFGVVLLEVLCARPAIDLSLPHEQVNLAEWALFCKSKGEIDVIVDPPLRGQIEPNSLRKFLEAAEKCLKENGGERPGMTDVVWDLEYALQLQRMTIDREEGQTGLSNLPMLNVIESFSS